MPDSVGFRTAGAGRWNAREPRGRTTARPGVGTVPVPVASVGVLQRRLMCGDSQAPAVASHHRRWPLATLEDRVRDEADRVSSGAAPRRKAQAL